MGAAAEPSVTRILAIRHGETAWNAAARIQGQLDIGLNETGRWQALRLAQTLANEPFAAVYASDLCRASDTGRRVAVARGFDLQTDRGLRERSFGAFEGLTAVEIEQRFPEAARLWRQREPGFGPAGGEPLQEFNDRAVRAVLALAARHRGQQIALVTHGGVLDALYRAATGVALNAPRTWTVGNASISRLVAGDAGLTLLDWADTAHLAAPSIDEFSDGATGARCTAS